MVCSGVSVYLENSTGEKRKKKRRAWRGRKRERKVKSSPEIIPILRHTMSFIDDEPSQLPRLFQIAQ
jgi:hypothetical protein